MSNQTTILIDGFSGDENEELVSFTTHKNHGHSHAGKGEHSHSHGGGGGRKHSHSHGGGEDEKPLLGEAQVRDTEWDSRIVSFWLIGVITLVYCVLELGIGGWLTSLTLMSDGFHNLSDVVSLVIAHWATQAAKRPQSNTMSFGWVRTEILGGLINGVFLLALCLYTGLEAIFRLIEPSPIRADWWFIGIAAAGIAVNAIGTVVFCLTGHGHSHGPGGGDHGHSHGGHGHSHGGHGHSHGGDSSSSEEDSFHVHEASSSSSSHAHASKKKKPKRDMNVYAVFLHYMGDMFSSMFVLLTGLLMHYFGCDERCSGPKEYGGFDGQEWTLYLDPISSLLIVALILYTTVPLVTRCSWILLQKAPNELDVDQLSEELEQIEGVLNIHDLHIWQLVDGMVVCSAHVTVEEGIDWNYVSAAIREALHSHGIHSSSIQPEFMPRAASIKPFCEQNCVDDCDEDWCCSTPAKEHEIQSQASLQHYGIN